MNKLSFRHLAKHYVHNCILSQRCAPNMMALAIELGMSERTLRRKLAREGVSYRDIKRHVRCQLVSDSSEQSPDELAARAGFAEVRSLKRLQIT